MKKKIIKAVDLQSVQNLFFLVFLMWLNMQICDFLVAVVDEIREFKIFDRTVAKTLLKIASSSSSIFFVIVSLFNI